jgi:hypothetical protein
MDPLTIVLVVAGVALAVKANKALDNVNKTAMKTQDLEQAGLSFLGGVGDAIGGWFDSSGSSGSSVDQALTSGGGVGEQSTVDSGGDTTFNYNDPNGSF